VDSRAARVPLPVVVSPEVYALRSELGRGSMGGVALATDRRLDRPVALKELLPGAADAAGRFEREAITTARLC
jgi:serine/threonine protein kinase